MRPALVLIAILTSATVGYAVLAGSGPEGCKPGAVHQVVIRAGRVIPTHTAGKLCERLAITNQDKQDRLIAFGPHEDHVPYDGTSERLLRQGQSLTVTLVQAGSFRFHDHLQDEVQGTFTVSP